MTKAHVGILLALSVVLSSCTWGPPESNEFIVALTGTPERGVVVVNHHVTRKPAGGFASFAHMGGPDISEETLIVYFLEANAIAGRAVLPGIYSLDVELRADSSSPIERAELRVAVMGGSTARLRYFEVTRGGNVRELTERSRQVPIGGCSAKGRKVQGLSLYPSGELKIERESSAPLTTCRRHYDRF